MNYLARGALAWLCIAIAEMLHGALRYQFLRPLFGDLASRQLGVFTGSIIILTIALLAIRWIGAVNRLQLVAVGTIWIVLMLVFEIAMGRVFGFSWERIASDYDPLQGGLMILGMAVLFLSPLATARLRGIGRHRGTE